MSKANPAVSDSPSDRRATEARSLQDMLRESEERRTSNEERYRSLTRSANDGIISADDSGTIVFWNEAAQRMFGYSAREVIGQPLSLIIPERFQKTHQYRMESVVSTGQSKVIGNRVEVAGLRNDGAEFPVELSLASWRTKDGVFFTGILRDITERKRADAVREKLTHELGERVKELNCLYGLSKLVEQSSASLDEILQGAAELLPGGWQYPDLTRARICFEGREFRTGDFEIAPWRQSADITVHGAKSGKVELCYQRETPTCDEGPFLKEERSLLEAIAGRLGRFVERRRAEEALQKTKEKLEVKVRERTSELSRKEESLAEAQRIVHLGNWDWDITTNELLWSDEVYRIFGFQPQEFSATYDSFLETVHPDDRERLNQALKRALRNPGADYSVDHRVVRPDGSERIVHERGELVFDRDGRPTRMIGTVHDVTDRKRLEKEILTVGEEEQRRIGQELHDGLGQELTGLSYLAKSLHRKLEAKAMPEAKAAGELAQAIPHVLGQLQAIVKGLLPLEVDAEDLSPALQLLADNVQERTGVSCCFKCAAHVPLSDDNTAVQLYRIAQEAVNNAVKHGQAQGILVKLKADDHQIILEVCDDGVGIDADVEKSSGSGLRTMRYRAQAIGERLTSNGGQQAGRLSLASFHGRNMMTVTAEPHVAKRKIFIVDDHPIVRRGLRELVAGEPDLEVCGEAEDVPGALQQIDATRPDVVVVDLSLKGGHGLDLMQEIKARNMRTKMLVSTMHDESLFAERALRAGATGYISKQESPDKIVGALRKVLHGEIYLSQRMANRLLQRITAGQSPEKNPIDDLSDRELGVFEMIGQGLGTKEIARKLDLSPKTIEAHREKIKSKLNLRSASELGRHAMQWVLENS